MKRLQSTFSSLVFVTTFLVPWPVRRALWQLLYRYEIHATAKVGLSWIRPKRLIMHEGARIGHLNVCKGVESLELGAHSIIGRLNWISGFPLGDKSHFLTSLDRNPRLILLEHAGLTNRHILDCTDEILIGAFATVAGFRSQFFTHSIDLSESLQKSAPICIGSYTFVGTGVIVLPGSKLPDRCVLGAGSVLNRALEHEDRLYAGVPARLVKELDVKMGYFVRENGFVD